MTCPCGYYSACTEGCTPERIKAMRDQDCEILTKTNQRMRELIVEAQKDSDEAKEERHS